MEVKETQATNPLLFNKSAALNASSEALGAGFASFLQQTNMSIVDSLAAPKSEMPIKEVTKDAAKEAKNSVSDKRLDDKKNDNIKSKKSDASSKKDISKKAKSDEDVSVKGDEVPRSEKVSAEDAVAVVQVGVVEDASVAVESVEDSISVVESTVSDASDTSDVIVANSAVSAKTDGLPTLALDTKVVFGDKVTSIANLVSAPEVLASLGSEPVTLIDAQTGELYTTTGAELLKKLQAQDVIGDKGISIDGMTAVAKGETIAPEALLAVKKTLDKVVGGAVKAQSENVADVVALAPNPLLETKDVAAVKVPKRPQDMTIVMHEGGEAPDVADLQALLGDVDLEVSVTSKEEKIAYTATSDLVKDKSALRDVLSQALKVDAKTDKVNQATLAPAVDTVQANNAQNAASKSNVLNFVPMANANVQAQPVVENIVVSASSVSSLSEVSSTTLASAGTSGSEFVNNAKAENLAKANETSFRDVYKGMSKEVVDQVKVNITKSAVKGIDKIDVSLKPEDLGRIEIKMQIKDGKLQAHIISSRPETMEILQKDVQSLEKAFNDAGFQTDEGSLSFSFHDGNQAGSGQDKNAELRNFLGNIFENEKSNELVNAESNYNWSPENGLNIRV